jgi:hypothetical protein
VTSTMTAATAIMETTMATATVLAMGMMLLPPPTATMSMTTMAAFKDGNWTAAIGDGNDAATAANGDNVNDNDGGDSRTAIGKQQFDDNKQTMTMYVNDDGNDGNDRDGDGDGDDNGDDAVAATNRTMTMKTMWWFKDCNRTIAIG